MYYANVIMIESDSTRPWPCAAGGEEQTAQLQRMGVHSQQAQAPFPSLEPSVLLRGRAWVEELLARRGMYGGGRGGEGGCH